MLTRVPRVRDAESELEVEGLQQLVAEKVTLDHAESVHWFGAYRELHAGK